MDNVNNTDFFEESDSQQVINPEGLEPIIETPQEPEISHGEDPFIGIDQLPQTDPEEHRISGLGNSNLGGFDCTTGCAGNCAGSCNWMCQNSAHNTPI